MWLHTACLAYLVPRNGCVLRGHESWVVMEACDARACGEEQRDARTNKTGWLAPFYEAVVVRCMPSYARCYDHTLNNMPWLCVGHLMAGLAWRQCLEQPGVGPQQAFAAGESQVPPRAGPRRPCVY